MNKIFRMAIVCTLAGAALLYTGCTKDYSGDVKEISSEVSQLQTQVAAVNSALDQYKATANAEIAKIANKADASTVNALKAEVDNLKPIVNANKSDIADLKAKVQTNADNIAAALGQIAGLEGDLETLSGAVGTLEGDVAGIKTDIEALKAAKTAFDGTADELLDAILGLQNRITNIVPVPSMDTTLTSIGITGASADTVTVFSAKFLVRPKEAATLITKDNANILLARGTKAVSNKVPATMTITTVNAKEDGTVEVFASAKKTSVKGATNVSDDNPWYYALDVTVKDDVDSTYYVISDYAKATVADSVYKITDLFYRFKGDTKLTAAVADSIAVPYDAADSKYAPLEKFSIKMVLGGNALTPAEGAALLGIDEKLTAVFDTSVVNTATIAAAAVKFDKADQSFSIIDASKAKLDIYAVSGKEDVNTNNGFLAKDSTVLANVVPITYKYRVARSVKDLGAFAAQNLKWNYTQAYTFTTAVSDIDTTQKFTAAVTGKTKSNDAIPTVAVAYTPGQTKAAITFTNFPVAKTGDQTAALTEVNATDTLKLSVPVTISDFPGDTIVSLGDSTYKIAAIPVPAKTFTFNPEAKYAAIPKADTTKYFGDLTAAAGGTSTALYAAWDAINYVYDTTIVTNADGSATTKVLVKDVDINVHGVTGNVTFAAGVLEFGKNYKVKFHKNAFGHKYLVEFNVVVPEATFALAKTENVDENNVVTVEGDSVATPGVYTIAKAFIKNYLTVREKADNSLSPVTGLTVNTTLTFEDSSKFKKTGIPTVLNSHTVTIATNPANVTAGLIDAATNIDWAQYEGREITAHVVLMGGSMKIDSVDLKLVAQKPVSATFGDIALNRPVGADTTFSIAKNLKVYGVLKPTVNIINPATGLQTGTIDYKVVVTPDWTKVEGSVAGGARRALNSTEFAGAGMNLTIKGDSHNPTMIVYVPVTIEYYLDYNTVEAIKGEVKVVATGTATE